MNTPDSADQLARRCRLGEGISVMDAALDDLRHERRELIESLLDAGYTEREIATAAGVTQARVHQIKTGART